MKKLETFDNFLNEIRAEEATTDETAIKTVIDGKREMAYVAITEQRMIDPRDSIAALREAINRGLKIIPLKGRDEGIAFIVYRRDDAKAKKFATFVEKRGGYLNDSSPEEARFIGQMLDYEESDIVEYIKDRYGK